MDLLRALISLPDAPQTGRAPHGSPILVHVTGAQTNGVFGMWETFVPAGAGPAAHMHTREFEVFRVISGRFRFLCGEEIFDAPEGSVVTLPPHVPHSWTNVGDTTGQLMGIVSPAGFEQLFLDVAKLDKPSPRDIAQIEKRLGIENDETRRLHP